MLKIMRGIWLLQNEKILNLFLINENSFSVLQKKFLLYILYCFDAFVVYCNKLNSCVIFQRKID